MKKFIAFIGITLSLAVVLSTAFVAYARPPVRVQFLAALYDGDGSTANRSLNIIPVSNNIFGLSSSTTLNTATRMYLWFRTDETDILMFSITLKLLSSEFQFNTSANNKAYMRLCNINYNNSGNVTIDGNVTLGDSVTISYADDSITYNYAGKSLNKNGVLLVVTFMSCMLAETPLYFEITNFSINGDQGVVSATDQRLDDMWNYDSQGGSSDTAGAESLVESISGDVDNINNTIQQHTPNVQNWFNTSTVSGDLMNIALLANSWLTAYLYVDPDVAFYWSLVTFCILLTLIENGLRRRPWHGFDDGEFNTEYDVESTDSRGRTRVIHNKVTGRRVR